MGKGNTKRDGGGDERARRVPRLHAAPTAPPAPPGGPRGATSSCPPPHSPAHPHLLERPTAPSHRPVGRTSSRTHTSANQGSARRPCSTSGWVREGSWLLLAIPR